MRILRGERGKFIPLIIRYGAALVLENEMVAAEDDLLTVNGAVDAVGNDVFDLGVALVVVQPRRIASFTTAFAIECG